MKDKSTDYTATNGGCTVSFSTVLPEVKDTRTEQEKNCDCFTKNIKDLNSSIETLGWLIFIAVCIHGCCTVVHGAEPNLPGPLHIQFIGTHEGYIVIEELSPRVVKYKSIDPNKAQDFSWTVDDIKTYRLNSEAALHYTAVAWPYFMRAGTAMANMNILSQFWRPVVVKPAEIVEPVYITKSGSKYHKMDCRYLPRTPICVSKADAQRRGLEACSLCYPEPTEPNLAEVLAGVTDPNLIKALLPLLENEKNE